MDLQKELIRNKGLKLTSARIAVLNILTETKKPIDIPSILTQVNRRKVNADQATVYRIIENFTEKELITRYQFQEKKFYYEAKREDHHHAICTQCGTIVDVSKCNIPRLEKEINRQSGFLVKTHSLEFYGMCRDCR